VPLRCVRSKLRRVKKANGQVLTCHELHEKNTRVVKNYGIWLRYESRTGTHNMCVARRADAHDARARAVVGHCSLFASRRG
jgi:hypothetical protein